MSTSRSRISTLSTIPMGIVRATTTTVPSTVIPSFSRSYVSLSSLSRSSLTATVLLPSSLSSFSLKSPLLRSKFATATKSVVEEQLAIRELQKQATIQSNPPVPIEEGEVLIYSSGASTKRTVLVSWAGAGTCSLYLGTAKVIELFGSSDITLLSPLWTMIFGSVAALTLFLARSTTKSCVKYAVLTKDGTHLRVYPYGSFLGINTGTPVTIPIPLLKINETFGKRKKDAMALHVKVKDSRAHLIFDKPVGIGLPSQPGTGLIFDKDGLNGIEGIDLQYAEAANQAGILDRIFKRNNKENNTVPSPSSSSSAASSSSKQPITTTTPFVLPTLSIDSLGLLDKVTRNLFNRYAILVYILNGNCVNTGKIVNNDYSLEKMHKQIRTNDELLQSLWKKATDKEGREYWYHEVTWQTQWTKPQLVKEGK